MAAGLSICFEVRAVDKWGLKPTPMFGLFLSRLPIPNGASVKSHPLSKTHELIFIHLEVLTEELDFTFTDEN